jgi:hypothetical protein
MEFKVFYMAMVFVLIRLGRALSLQSKIGIKR